MGPSQRSGRQALHSPWERRRPLCPGGLPALVHPLPRGGSASLPGRACSRRCLALLPPEPTPAGLTGRMGACGRKALTLLSSVFAVCSLGLLGIAVSTDYWLYLEEGVVLAQNQSTETRMSLHSGLWRVCFLAGKCALTAASTAPERSSSPTPNPPGSSVPAGRRHSRGRAPLGDQPCPSVSIRQVLSPPRPGSSHLRMHMAPGNS